MALLTLQGVMAAFARLPVELQHMVINAAGESLPQSDLTHLARVSKTFATIIQPHLYGHFVFGSIQRPRHYLALAKPLDMLQQRLLLKTLIHQPHLALLVHSVSICDVWSEPSSCARPVAFNSDEDQQTLSHFYRLRGPGNLRTQFLNALKVVEREAAIPFLLFAFTNIASLDLRQSNASSFAGLAVCNVLSFPPRNSGIKQLAKLRHAGLAMLPEFGCPSPINLCRRGLALLPCLSIELEEAILKSIAARSFPNVITLEIQISQLPQHAISLLNDCLRLFPNVRNLTVAFDCPNVLAGMGDRLGEYMESLCKRLVVLRTGKRDLSPRFEFSMNEICEALLGLEDLCSLTIYFKNLGPSDVRVATLSTRATCIRELPALVRLRIPWWAFKDDLERAQDILDSVPGTLQDLTLTCAWEDTMEARWTKSQQQRLLASCQATLNPVLSSLRSVTIHGEQKGC